MKRSLLVFASLSLLACATQIERDINNPWYAPPPGTRVILPEPVQIPPRSARAFFQDGRITAGGINHFAPHCELEVNEVKDVSQTVRAGEFVVTHVSQRNHEVVSSGRIQVAGRFGVGIGVGFGLFNSDVGDIMKAWHLRLESPDQPNVRALICGGAFDHPSLAETPSIAEIRAALGEHVILELPPLEGSTRSGLRGTDERG